MNNSRDHVYTKMMEMRARYHELKPLVKQQHRQETILQLLSLGFIIVGAFTNIMLSLVGWVAFLFWAAWTFKGTKLKADFSAAEIIANTLQDALNIADMIVKEERLRNGSADIQDS